MVFEIHRGPQEPRFYQQDVQVKVTKHGLKSQKKMLQERQKFEIEQAKLRIAHQHKLYEIMEEERRRQKGKLKRFKL